MFVSRFGRLAGQVLGLTALLMCLASAPAVRAQTGAATAGESAPSGPIRLRQPSVPETSVERQTVRPRSALEGEEQVRPARPVKPGDFELFVRRLAGQSPTDPDGIRRLAQIAHDVNERTENIGARRLATVMERLLDDVSFDAPNRAGQTVAVDAAMVDAKLGELAKNEDLSRYVL